MSEHFFIDDDMKVIRSELGQGHVAQKAAGRLKEASLMT